MPLVEVKTADQPSTRQAKPSRVILYNDDWHTFDDVIVQLVKATGMNPRKALDHAMNVHTKGRDVVHQADRDDCERVAGVLREIRLQTEVDWDD